jgi:hypothetical protein
MEKPKRARKRKPETSQGGPEATDHDFFGGQGVHREMESEGHDGEVPGRNRWGYTPKMNRSAKGGTRSSLHYEGEGGLIHPPHQGVCGRHGTEEQCVTSGRLAESPVGTGVNRPISESEVASDALSVDGRLCSTTSATKIARPGNRQPNELGKTAGEGGWE